MDIRQVLTKYHQIEIDLLLSAILKKPREFIFLHPETKLSSNQVRKLSSLVKRRQKGEPIAYILGYKDFYGLRFKVNKNVLVPRPETETLIDRIKNLEFRIKDRGIKILDVGTGSGCIAISLAKLMEIKNQKSEIKIYASDISAAALKVARENAKHHRVKIKFIQSDLLQNVRILPDIIVANLPYVPKKNYELRIKNLGWEPKIALIDSKKDFDIYQRLLKQIAGLPSLPKLVFLEIDPKQKILLPKVIKKYLPKAKVKFYRDFKHLWRFAEITI